MVLLVCASIFSLALGLIIGLEDLGSFSYSFAAGWMLWCWHAEWPACKKKELKVSFRLSQKHEPPGGGGETKHDVTRERSKCESLIYLLIMGGMCVCVCVKMWGHVVSLQFYADLLHVVQHRHPPPPLTLMQHVGLNCITVSSIMLLSVARPTLHHTVVLLSLCWRVMSDIYLLR